MSKNLVVRVLGAGEAAVLDNVMPDTFDNAIIPESVDAFFKSPTHDIAVALDQGLVVGMASGAMLFHPDKPPAYFVAEVGVHENYHRQGIGTKLCTCLMEHARAKGSKGIWVATEDDNEPARQLYKSLGARETSGIVVYDWDGAMDD